MAEVLGIVSSGFAVASLADQVLSRVLKIDRKSQENGFKARTKHIVSLEARGKAPSSYGLHVYGETIYGTFMVNVWQPTRRCQAEHIGI